MAYKAKTNVYGKRLIKAGEIITDSEYSSLSAVPRNRFVFLEADPAPNPAAGQSAGDEQSSADQSATGDVVTEPAAEEGTTDDKTDEPELTPEASADQSAEETVPFYEEKIIQGNPAKDPDIVTSNPDREYLNDAAKAKKLKQNKNK